MSYAQDLQVAIELAKGAGKIVMDCFGKVRRLTKTHAAANNEAVTEADRASQRFVAEGLRRHFPDDGLIGEESETGESITFDKPRAGSRVWVIDPIDGTNNFVAGLPIFSVCIGLLVDGSPVVGVVYDVSRNAMYSAAKGEGAYLGRQKIHAAQTPLNDSSVLMLTSNAQNAQGKTPAYVNRWIAQTALKVRILGSASLEAVYVAAGAAHGAITINSKLWDIAAPAAILAEAGAVLTDTVGRPIFPFDLKDYKGAKVPFLAAAPQAHGELLKQVMAE